jgi:hypothetical protein
VRRALGAEPERALEHVGLEDRLNHDLRRRLNNTVTDSRNRQWPLLRRPTGLRDEHPAGRERSPRSRLQILGQLVEKLDDAVPLDLDDGLAVDAGRASVGTYQLPRTLQNVSAVDLVVERMEPSPGIGLGRPVKRSLQFSDLVLLGGPSHDVALTSPSLYVTHERSSGPSHHRRFCCPVSSAVHLAASDPHPARKSTSRLNTGYRTRRSDRTMPQAAGPGRASPVPAATL